MSKKQSLQKAVYGSDKTPLHLGELDVPCYVLEDGTRVLSRSGIQKAIGYTGRSGEMLTRLVTEKNGFPEKIVAGVLNPIPFIRPDAGGSQPATNGYEATLFIDICNAIIDLDRAGVLNDNQREYAYYADIIIRSVAKVGIIALIDEATGYQYDREKDELQKILKAYISEELLAWEKRFPDEFYREIFRLNDWGFTVSQINARPGIIGTWTKKYIYSVLPKGVLQALLEKTPRNDKGKLKAHLHRSLTREQGIEHLNKQIISVVTLMNISDNWRQFESLWNKKFGQQELML